MSSLFPELDGVFPSRPQGGGARDAVADANTDAATSPLASADKAPAGGVEAGVASLRNFARAFELVEELREVRLLEDDVIRCTVELGGRAHVVSLVPPDRPAWLGLPGFGIRVKGEGPPPPLALKLRRFAARYRGATLAQFASRVVPEAGARHVLPWDDATTLFYSYASAKAWRTFFEDNELYRGVCERFTGNVVRVSHEELECGFNSVRGCHTPVGFFNTVAVEESRSSPNTTTFLSTDLQDLDVIKGGDARLDRALESIAAFPEKPSMVLVSTTCVPLVTGDDIEASAARARAKLQLPVVFVGNENNPQELLLRRLLETPRRRDVEVAPGRVNLLGFPPLAGREQLFALLSACGIEVGCQLFPNLDPDALADYERAALQVVYPWRRYLEPVEYLVKAFAHIPTVRPPSPFGMQGAARWLATIADALGRADALETAWGACEERLGPRWRQLQAQARGYRLGFVCDDGDWRVTLGAQRCMGVPLLEMLLEMGFAGADVFVFAGVRRPRPASDPRISVRGYSSARELEDGMRRSSAVAFYSEMSFDRRLTRTGKNSFSLREVSCGPDGAVATLERLLARCRLPFYRRYARYLGDPFPPPEVG